MDQVIELCDGLEKKFLVVPSTVNLSTHPTLFLPILGYIINEIERIKADTEERVSQPRSFSLCSSPGLHWRHILINNKSLKTITFVKADDKYEENLKQFYKVFDFKKLGFKSLEELKNVDGKVSFTCAVQCDGFGISFIFARKKVLSDDQVTSENLLQLEDFSNTEAKTYFQPVAVDQGRRQVFTAAIKRSDDEVEFRRCSTKERPCYAGTKRRTKQIERLKLQQNIKEIESNLPSSKTISLRKYEEYVIYLLENLPVLLNFYGRKSAAFCFHDYQGRQKASAEMANILVNVEKKYDETRKKKTKKNRKHRKQKHKGKRITKDKSALVKCRKPIKDLKKCGFKKSSGVPLIAFGDGMKNKDTVAIKGYTSGVTGVLYREIKQRSKIFESAVVDINEFRTSKVCNNCKQIKLVPIKFSRKSFHGILDFKLCRILWDRDINARKNMLDISFSVWKGEGRLLIFKREIAAEKAVLSEKTI